jgi:hypothetical protein
MVCSVLRFTAVIGGQVRDVQAMAMRPQSTPYVILFKEYGWRNPLHRFVLSSVLRPELSHSVLSLALS